MASRLKRTTGRGASSGNEQKGRNAYTKPLVVAPIRPFLYTLDQIASMLAIDERELIGVYLFIDGRSTFPKAKHHITARNIAPPDKSPEWRVAEAELIRWMETMGFDYRPPGSIQI